MHHLKADVDWSNGGKGFIHIELIYKITNIGLKIIQRPHLTGCYSLLSLIKKGKILYSIYKGTQLYCEEEKKSQPTNVDKNNKKGVKTQGLNYKNPHRDWHRQYAQSDVKNLNRNLVLCCSLLLLSVFIIITLVVWEISGKWWWWYFEFLGNKSTLVKCHRVDNKHRIIIMNLSCKIISKFLGRKFGYKWSCKNL